MAGRVENLLYVIPGLGFDGICGIIVFKVVNGHFCQNEVQRLDPRGSWCKW